MAYNVVAKQQEVREIAQEFAKKEIAPIAKELDRRPPEFPMDLFKKMGRLGFLGYPMPKEYGGQGKSKIEHVTLIEEISYHDASAGVIMAVGNLASYPIEKWGTEEQKRKYLPGMASGELIGAFALTEPNAGSDAANQQTEARSPTSQADYYIVNGDKIFITNGNVADVVVLICKIAQEDQRGKVSALIFDADTPGFSAEVLKYKMGIRASTTGRLFFKDCRVPKENLLGEIGKGFKMALNTLDGARTGIAAQSVGIAQRAFDESVNYAKTREQFGAPIAKLQAIQWMIADMATRLEAARLLTYKAAQLEDEGKPFGKEAAQAKLFASETANFVADKALQIHGGYGYIGEFSEIERLYRDARITEIYEGTSEVQRLVIASHILR